MLRSGQRRLQKSVSIMPHIFNAAVAECGAAYCSVPPWRAIVSAMSYYLGIDAGGSQTTCAIGDGRVVLGRSHGTACKLSKVGEKQAREVLLSLVQECCKTAGVMTSDIEHTCIGVAGISGQKVTESMHALVSEMVSGEIKVIGDMMIALEAAFGDAPGVVVIAGTGSIAFGRNQRGDTARAGGWGPMVSDEGSGEWIGRQAIAHAMRSYDEGASTSLIAEILEIWRVATRDEIATRANASPPPDFAQLFPAVIKSAAAHDSLSKEILTSAGMELARLARIVVRKLWLGPAAVNIRVSGGVITNSQLVRDAFQNTLRSERPDVIVTFEPVEPVLGALAVARKASLAAKA
jgi:N-acetylglucosamine kinase-like BadF-type ATPase